jgi:hypothetical protein
MYRPALGPTQPPIQWVPGTFSFGVKRPGREADHSPQSSAEFKECLELYLHSPNTSSWRSYLYLYYISVSIETRLRVERPRFNCWQGLGFFLSAPIQWAPGVLSARVKRKLTTHLHLVSSLRTRGAIPPLLNMSSWGGAWLSKGYISMVWCLVKHRENYFIFNSTPRFERLLLSQKHTGK